MISHIIFILNLLISSLLFSMEFILEIITSPEIKGSSPGCWERRDWPITYTNKNVVRGMFVLGKDGRKSYFFLEWPNAVQPGRFAQWLSSTRTPYLRTLTYRPFTPSLIRPNESKKVRGGKVGNYW